MLATGYIAAFLWGVNGIYEGVISFGVMTAFLQLVGQVQRPMVDLSRYIPSLAQSVTSAEWLKELDDIALEEQGEQLLQEGKIYLYNRTEKLETSPLARSNLVYVPQGNTLLSGTIRDNLLLGNPEATEEQMNEVLTTVVAEFVYDLPEVWIPFVANVEQD